MKRNNSATSIMFEEIKNHLVTIMEKLDGKTINKGDLKDDGPSDKAGSGQNTESKIAPQQTEQLIRVIATHLNNTEQKIERVSETVKESEQHVLSQANEIKKIIEELKSDTLLRRHSVLDLKVSKVAVTIIVLFLLFLVSMLGNIHQFKVNSHMEDNDLKYRYIRSVNGINPENLKKLDEIFRYPREKKKIREIREKTKEYENRIGK